MTNKCEHAFKFFKVTKNQSLLDVANIVSVPPQILINLNNITENISNGDVIIYDKTYRLTVVDFDFFIGKTVSELDKILKLNEIDYFYIGQLIAIE